MPPVSSREHAAWRRDSEDWRFEIYYLTARTRLLGPKKSKGTLVKHGTASR